MLSDMYADTMSVTSKPLMPSVIMMDVVMLSVVSPILKAFLTFNFVGPCVTRFYRNYVKFDKNKILTIYKFKHFKKNFDVK